MKYFAANEGSDIELLIKNLMLILTRSKIVNNRAKPCKLGYYESQPLSFLLKISRIKIPSPTNAVTYMGYQ